MSLFHLSTHTMQFCIQETNGVYMVVTKMLHCASAVCVSTIHSHIFTFLFHNTAEGQSKELSSYKALFRRSPVRRLGNGSDPLGPLYQCRHVYTPIRAQIRDLFPSRTFEGESLEAGRGYDAGRHFCWP